MNTNNNRVIGGEIVNMDKVKRVEPFYTFDFQSVAIVHWDDDTEPTTILLSNQKHDNAYQAKYYAKRDLGIS